MWKPSGIAAVATQTDSLSCLDTVANLDERAVLGEVGIRRNRVVCVTNLDPVGLSLTRLAVTKLHAYLGNDSCPRSSDGGADGHDKIIGILVGTVVAAGRAIRLTDKMSGANRIR